MNLPFSSKVAPRGRHPEERLRGPVLIRPEPELELPPRPALLRWRPVTTIRERAALQEKFDGDPFDRIIYLRRRKPTRPAAEFCTQNERLAPGVTGAHGPPKPYKFSMKGRLIARPVE